MKRSYNEYRIMAAFNLLMDRYEYDDVTVAMVCGMCGLSRQSFYKYFESKQVLCSRMIGVFFRDCLKDGESFTWEELMERYVRQVDEYVDLFHMVESLPLFRPAEESLQKAIGDVCLSMYRHRTGRGPDPETSGVISFYASGVAWTFIEAVRRGMRLNRPLTLRRLLLSEPEMLKEMLGGRYPAGVYASAFPGVEEGGLDRIRGYMKELRDAPDAQIPQKAK